MAEDKKAAAAAVTAFMAEGQKGGIGLHKKHKRLPAGFVMVYSLCRATVMFFAPWLTLPPIRTHAHTGMIFFFQLKRKMWLS
jgi:hypothetical protein